MTMAVRGDIARRFFLSVAELTLEHVGIRYDSDAGGTVVACDGVDLRVETGEFVALAGRSGCGKSSLLYAIDGLLPLAAGRIALDDTTVEKPGRDRALVFQSPTLFPWRNVIGNVKYGIEAYDRAGATGRAEELVRLVGLEGFENHHPHQLSGGMQQRVNLARALAVDPEVLLLDEPFAALDAQTRDSMQSELLRIWTERNGGDRRLTMIFVTHDIAEAVFLADRVVVFTPRPGRVREIVPIDLPRPRDARVKRSPEFQALVERIALLLEEGGL
jgi:NitT/TauT family transport system ATP-binding protein